MNKSRSSTLGNVVKIMKMVVQQFENRKKSDDGTSEEKDNSGIKLPTIEKLIKRGFSPEDVSLAMSWLAILGMTLRSSAETPSPGTALPSAMKEQEDDKKANHISSGFRVLHISESIRLTDDAQSVLLNLLNSGAVQPGQFEKFIQFIWQNDLRDISPTRLEILLSLQGASLLTHDSQFALSDKLPPPAYIN
ncbi:MAG: DUF494 family protein [Candidatus Riflebacteria bacterium]|nr:DUF494 family protein [Candidatus Riflebacteria bacterium]